LEKEKNMLKSLLKEIFITMITATVLMPTETVFAGSQNIQSYLPPSFKDSDRLAKIHAVLPEIDEMYKEYAEKNHFPGYAYGIMVDGQLVYSRAGGFINLDKKTPATAQSMFRIASITKSFTAIAILRLRDENKLKLDDPVYIYIPEIKDQQLTADASVITIRDLLTHSAG
jgi:CubicO group peptidase (beta-lactamase class C family)